MKQNTFKTIMKSLLIGLICILGMQTTVLYAAEAKPAIAKRITEYSVEPSGALQAYYCDGYNNIQKMVDQLPVKNLLPNDKITNLKSSNKKVVIPYVTKSTKNRPCIELTAKGFGSTTISFTVKRNGKSYKMSTVYTLKKVPCPFKQVLIDGTSMKIFNKNSWHPQITTGKKSGKIRIVPQNNVKITSIQLNYPNGKSVNVKNGSTINLQGRGKWLSVAFEYRNTKGYNGKPCSEGRYLMIN